MGGGCIGCDVTVSFLTPGGSFGEVKVELDVCKSWDVRDSFGDTQDAGIDIRLTSEEPAA